MSRNIVAQQAHICNRTFHGWENVPRHYKTRAAWKRAFRRVKKGEKAAAVVLVGETRRFNTIDAEYQIERKYSLFHVAQTQPIKKTPLNTAQHEFYDHFVRHANRNKLIRWTKGEWKTTEDGEKWWDEAADLWGWRTYQEHFSFDQCLDHLKGKAVAVNNTADYARVGYFDTIRTSADDEMLRRLSIGPAISIRHLPAKAASVSAPTFIARTRNSSPPQRPTMSLGRRPCDSVLHTVFSARSPVECP